jgi:hypothetical protein
MYCIRKGIRKDLFSMSRNELEESKCYVHERLLSAIFCIILCADLNAFGLLVVGSE